MFRPAERAMSLCQVFLRHLGFLNRLPSADGQAPTSYFSNTNKATAALPVELSGKDTQKAAPLQLIQITHREGR